MSTPGPPPYAAPGPAAGAPEAPPYPADGLAAAAPAGDRPELKVAAAFAGGVALALLLKRFGRVS